LHQDNTTTYIEVVTNRLQHCVKLARPGFELQTYHTRGAHVNRLAVEVVQFDLKKPLNELRLSHHHQTIVATASAFKDM